MGAVGKIKEWLFGTHERKEEKQIAMKPEEHIHPHEHQVTIYEEKPPALLHLRKKKPAEAEKKSPSGKKKITAHRKIKELKTMAKKKTTKKKVTKGKKKKR